MNIVLGICGSIAATKSQKIALALQHRKFQVKVAMTYSAQKVIGEAAIRAVTPEKVFTQMWESPNSRGGETHIEWAQWADAMVIAPATASCIASLCMGVYDNTVTLVAGNLPCNKLFIAPAMSMEMWTQPAVYRNVEQLKEWGARFLGPVEGKVASGDTGQRLMEARDIATKLDEQLSAES